MISIELYIPSMTDKEESRAEQRRADGMVCYGMVWYDINRALHTINDLYRGEQRRADGML